MKTQNLIMVRDQRLKAINRARAKGTKPTKISRSEVVLLKLLAMPLAHSPHKGCSSEGRKKASKSAERVTFSKRPVSRSALLLAARIIGSRRGERTTAKISPISNTGPKGRRSGEMFSPEKPALYRVKFEEVSPMWLPSGAAGFRLLRARRPRPIIQANTRPVNRSR